MPHEHDGSYTLGIDPELFTSDEGVVEAYYAATFCATQAHKLYCDLACGTPWKVRGCRAGIQYSIEELQDTLRDAEILETMYEDFALHGERIRIGKVLELSAHAAAKAFAEWVLSEIAWIAHMGLGVQAREIRKNYKRVLAHFAELPILDTSELMICLRKEAFRLAAHRRLHLQPDSQTVIFENAAYTIDHRDAFRIFEILYSDYVRQAGLVPLGSIKARLGKKASNARVDRYLRHLPKPLFNLIQRQVGRGGGYCIRLPVDPYYLR